ncbi:MarR family winged helix-turn-helix transcriptional regulator [Mycolicibacterium neworleansense]|uniref:MarR family winged helix-turn-helix transcriptional regulator n=1 Tax=Mycolicibacterium neworleansense TaxID=146018 RepID=UPI0013960A4E|nr:MarR family transcriptional regulator [Mycolicibacterium neworleansense]MCV7363479.1 MarR family transcriptional regulator [Mycolicibacterium neworleansense]
MKTKLELIEAIAGLMTTVSDRLGNDGDGDAERDFMAARCPQRLRQVVRTLPTSSLHLLAELAEGPVSVVGLAARSGRLKGTVSKHVQRLVEAGLVARTPVPGNRKEIELGLTGDGELVADVHRQLHEEMDRGTRDFLLRYTGADLQVLVKVLEDLAGAHKDGVRLVPPADRP